MIIRRTIRGIRTRCRVMMGGSRPEGLERCGGRHAFDFFVDGTERDRRYPRELFARHAFTLRMTIKI